MARRLSGPVIFQFNKRQEIQGYRLEVFLIVSSPGVV